jgi:transcriptional regulator with XRE-family HTH domain
MNVSELRLARGWSQVQLAEMSGLSLRTIQRIENGATPALESLKSLAAVFEIDYSDLQESLESSRRQVSLPDAVRLGLRGYADFESRSPRAEFWWFTLVLALIGTFFVQLGAWWYGVFQVIAILPWLAAASRRLRDAGQSPWWLLMMMVPIGGQVLLAILLAFPTKETR